MPPFRLEAPERPRLHHSLFRIIYSKNQYSDGVKYRQWQEILESQPFDVDPLCPGKVNHFLSHYHRLGTQVPSYSTTTQDMLQQVFIKNNMVPEKLMGNYYTYNEQGPPFECLSDYQECPQVCVDELVTTMQDSYQVPHPYPMQRLSFPKTPWMANRKYKLENPLISQYKFHDEGFEDRTENLRKHKGFRWVSSNPLIGNYPE